ncbi:hypothetical protein ACYTX7_09580, partial [Streptococcus pyogenes]
LEAADFADLQLGQRLACTVPPAVTVGLDDPTAGLTDFISRGMTRVKKMTAMHDNADMCTD